MEEKENWMTTEDVARKYGCTTRTVRNWVKDLGLPQVYLGKRFVRYIPSELETFFMEFER